MAKPMGKGLSLLIGIGKKKPSSEPSSDVTDSESDMGGDSEDTGDEGSMPGGAEDDKATMAASDLADELGVPEDKKEGFASAFKTAVKACVSSGY